jgi:deoxycytidylate deaminase
MQNIQKLYKKTTIYVVRCDNKENLQDSAPCQNCLETIIDLNIKRIVFSSKDNTFISASPKNLEIHHISAGNKFLKKNPIHR